MAASPAMAMLRSMVATSAIHDGERDEKDDYTRVCHPGTREDHLRDLTTWASSIPLVTRVEWLNAIAGAGKTAMLRTFCAELEEQSGFPSISFFVWQGDARRNNLKLFPATIAAQLCRRIPALVPHVEKAINEDSFLLQSAFKKQMDKLIIGPLLDACDAIKGERHLIIVIDGLDELDEKGLSDFLSFIPSLLRRLSSLPISLLVSSRPDAEIVAAFKHPALASITRSTRLGASDEDIWTFINDKFDDINIRYPHLQIEHGHPWPSHAKRAIMVMQSSGLFIWPTVAIDYIDKVKLGLGHNKRLEHVLSSAEPKPWIASPLDNLYRAILQAHAPEDPESVEFLRFKRRLALLCLPVNLHNFIWKFRYRRVLDWSDTPVRAVFDETPDELWGSVTGLSSLFSPSAPPSEKKSPTPAISHRSFRDFTFNRARCGDKLYYCSERELHAEVVCKLLKFFNTRQAYQSTAEMSGVFIRDVGSLLEFHLKEAAVSEELGHCMDDVILDAIPPTWPLITQVFVIINLFDGLYRLADNPEFPEGARRREAFLSKMNLFFKSRAAAAEAWDIAFFRLSFSTCDFDTFAFSQHSVYCWQVANSPQCLCRDAYAVSIPFNSYRHVLHHSILFQDARSRLGTDRQDNIAQDSLDVLRFFLSLSETSQRATELSSFITVKMDLWIITFLKTCPPNDDLYNALERICMVPLPSLPEREGDDAATLVEDFLWQTEAFNEYTKRYREPGIEKNLPRIGIPDDWWEDEVIRGRLLRFGYKPLFDIPEEWWKDRSTRHALLKERLRPPSKTPGKLSKVRETRRILLHGGRTPSNPYSSEETASESESDSSVENVPDEDEEPTTGKPGDEPLPGGDSLQEVVSPQDPLPPSHVATVSDPLPIQLVTPAHPTTASAVGTENDQDGPSAVVAGRRRRGFRKSLKNMFRR